ncbi:MAG: cysteine dioxygenase family protein [Acidobacteria bacterium]|nr:cysteine dioxygenase family protein [Acidobacteriota bacterium]
MSANITHTAPSPAPDKRAQARGFSFNELVERLRTLSRVPTLEEINGWMREVLVDEEDLLAHRGFKAATYARHRVVRSDHAELLILCWRPGQRTPIHDHNGSFGAVRVCEGVMWETIFAQDEAGKLRYISAREWQQGGVTGADVPDIHQIGNPDISGTDLVTLHLYAPPLGVLNTYRVGSAEIGHYMVDEFMDGAGI